MPRNEWQEIVYFIALYNMGNKDIAGNTTPAQIKRMLAGYNMIANLLWSVLNLIPVSVFCYRFMAPALFYPLLTISFLPAFLSQSFLNRIRLSKTTNIYNKMGVRFINRFTQNGDIISTLVRKKFPQFRLVAKNKLSVGKAVQQTYSFEKFHLILFVFFIATTIYASLYTYFSWAVIITFTNIIYNVYPILLQQYIRIRLKPFVEKNRI